ncbi:uncharacterized protein H6S33_004180 [Morchella sextelata]|uniref:uncharacterized protein n=1 Tax=Morchella sextelata TaxID=1174677 RepID=UPI001D03E0D0|nr:uncharacterized protein H6S33_004180 [Morchella sextelata]KAH0605723.1 hypothetical protein H6S33_004180 [Morchella sextelata]
MPTATPIQTPKVKAMAPAQIDHVVVLVPYQDLIDPPKWVTENFTLTPGGRHSDGKTENKLIVFSDGTYIELIAFINDNPSLRRGHPWGNKSYGFIDFALTTPAGSNFDYAGLRGRINQKSGSLGIDYDQPIEGGRKRDDGVDVRWKVTFPKNVVGAGVPGSDISRRGEIPFWCHDIAGRELRVDTVAANVTHPSGVKGIAQFTILVPDGKMDSYVDLYSSIMDSKPVRMFGTTRLPLETPINIPGLVKPWVFVEPPTLDVEKKRLLERGPGIIEIALRLGVEGKVGVGRPSIDENGVWIHFLK